MDLTIGLPSKNYPKRTPYISKSINWIKSYSDIYLCVSWFVQVYSWYKIIIRWPKETQTDLLHIEFYPSMVLNHCLKETKPYQTKSAAIISEYVKCISKPIHPWYVDNIHPFYWDFNTFWTRSQKKKSVNLNLQRLGGLKLVSPFFSWNPKDR